jgi:hypothetical protein
LFEENLLTKKMFVNSGTKIWMSGRLMSAKSVVKVKERLGSSTKAKAREEEKEETEKVKISEDASGKNDEQKCKG